MASKMFIWVAFIDNFAVRMQNSATGGNFTKISTKLRSLLNVAKKMNIAIPRSEKHRKNNFRQFHSLPVERQP